MDLNTTVTETQQSLAGSSRKETIGFVTRCLFGENSPEELSKLLSYTSSASYGPSEVVFREGDTADVVHVICSGLVKLISYLPNGRARIVRLHGRGSVLGLVGLMGHPHEHTAIAIEGVRAYRIPVSLLHGLKRSDPNLYGGLLEHWYQYLDTADMWITEFSTGPIRARVARLIRFLASIENEDESHQVTLLTSDEMAEVLGVTPESVSRVVADFKRSHVLRPLEPNDHCRIVFIEQPSVLDTEALDG
jgi:CRP-like cAMP-binding protein